MNEYLDSHGYPTKDALEIIHLASPEEIYDVLKEAWCTLYGTVSTHLSKCEWAMVSGINGKEDSDYLRLATGGWGGNEEIIDAYMENYLAYGLTWRLSRTGGLHIVERYGTYRD